MILNTIVCPSKIFCLTLVFHLRLPPLWCGRPVKGNAKIGQFDNSLFLYLVHILAPLESQRIKRGLVSGERSFASSHGGTLKISATASRTVVRKDRCGYYDVVRDLGVYSVRRTFCCVHRGGSWPPRSSPITGRYT